MRFYNEFDLTEFEPWSSDNFYVFTEEQIEMLEKTYFTDPHGYTETEVNDKFRFYEDELAQHLGFKNFDDLKAYNEEHS